MPDLLAKDLKAGLKLVVGSCVSLGVLVDSKEAKDIEADIDAGKYDNEISQEKTTPDEAKKKELDLHFKRLHLKQEKQKQAEVEAEKAEAAAKEAKAKTAEAGEGAAAPAEGEAPAAEAAAPAEGEEKPAEEKKE